MLRHPSKRYIYYLLSKQAMSTAEVVANLGDLGLPVPQRSEGMAKFVAQVLAERKRIVIPQGFNPHAESPSSDTLAFLDHWRIAGMWSNDPSVGLAVDILDSAQVRRMLETLLLGPLNYGSIARHVRSRFGIPEENLNTHVVQSYAHYFWDYSAMSASEWREMIWTWIPGHSDDYLMALLAPRTPGGAQLAVAAADRGGNSMDTITQFTTIRDHAFRMFMSHALIGKSSLQHTTGAKMAMEMIVTAEEELAKRRGGGAELLEELRSLQARHDETAVKTVHDLPVERSSPQLGSGAEDIEDAEKVEDEHEQQRA